MKRNSVVHSSILTIVAVFSLFGSLALPTFAQDTPPSSMPGGPGEGGLPFGNGHGVRGRVTEISGPELTVKTEEGDTYKVLTSTNTHIMKERQPAKAADIHVGDMVMVGGQVDAQEKTVGAFFIAVINPEQVAKMHEDLGKTWIAGKVTAIEDLKITIQRIDGVTQAIVVDENTSFQRRRDSITLADIKVGDNVNARGQLKDGVFTASQLSVGGMEIAPAAKQ